MSWPEGQGTLLATDEAHPLGIYVITAPKPTP